jgi:CheY-like chemotaxis protein
MSEARRRPQARVLIADDVDDHRRWMIEVLRGDGYILHEATNGQEVLDMLLAVRPRYFAVVVCDQFMPGPRGTECLALIASRAPFVIVTASRDARVEDAAAQFGAAAFLRKPFDASTLAELVRTIACSKPATSAQPKPSS